MEALYAKLYDKYTKLKKEKESQFDQLNYEQEVKFLNFVSAADEMIKYLKSDNDRLQSQVDELKSELASVRSSNEEQCNHFQKLLMEENKKSEELSEEIARLQNHEHNARSQCIITHEEIGPEQGSSHGDARDEVVPYDSIARLRKRKYVHVTEGAVIAHSVEELDNPEGQQAFDNQTSGHPPIFQQPLCCRKKINPGSNRTDNCSVDCVFQYLVELVVGLKVSPVAESNEPSVTAHHQSSGYSFSLTWITNARGEVELVYDVLSLGTLERVAPEWMKETLMFSTSMCSVFFERVSRAIAS